MPLLYPLPAVIFFDAVGTLLHPEPSAPAVYAAVGRRFGSRLDDSVIHARFRKAFGRQEEVDRVGNLRTNEVREAVRWQAIVCEVLDDVVDSQACFQELYAHFARADSWRCEPGTAELLATLAARGHVLGIASNFDRRLRRLVENIPALQSVRHLLISSEIGWRKPAPDFFATLCRQTNYPPEQILYVGDDPINDYAGARTAGLQAILFAPNGCPVVPAEAQIRSLSDLLVVTMNAKSNT